MWAASDIITSVGTCGARRRDVSQLAVVMNRLQTAESSFCQGNRRYVNGKSPRSRKEKPITTFSNQHSSFSRHSGARLSVASERMSEIPGCSDFDLILIFGAVSCFTVAAVQQEPMSVCPVFNLSLQKRLAYLEISIYVAESVEILKMGLRKSS